MIFTTTLVIILKTDIQSVLCNTQLINIKKITKKRKIFETYKNNLKINRNIKFYKFFKSETPWFVDIYVNNRENLISYLKKRV